MRRILVGLGILAFLGLGVFWLVTMPQTRDMAAYDGLTPDKAHGEQVFWATGCASCHAADAAEGDARLVLSGGQRFTSAFGTFLAPNISTDPEAGIGGWSLALTGRGGVTVEAKRTGVEKTRVDVVAFPRCCCCC